MCPPFDTDVLIIGAGPTGLVLANLLGKLGTKVIMVERNTGTVDEPRAVSIDDESMRALQAIGLDGDVLAIVTRAYGSRYKAPSGKVFASVDPLAQDYGFDKRNAFEQPALEKLLRGGLDRYKHVVQMFAEEWLSFEQDASGVTARLASGKEIRARFMVGCDGGRSAVRKTLGIELEGSTFAERWLIVDLVRTANRFRHTEVFCNPARPCISLPGPRGIRRYEFMLHGDESEEQAVAESFVRRLLGEVGPDRDAPLRRKRVYTFHARMATSWRRGRAFLAGDAAHLSPPFAGQGMNSGIRDAHNLGWKLATAVASAEDRTDLLDSYEAERKPHAWQMIMLALRMGKVMMPSSPAQAFLTRLAFRALGIYPPARDYVTQMRYKPKPRFAQGMLWPDGRPDAETQIGSLFPQPVIENEIHQRRRLDDALGLGPSLIVFSEQPDEVVGSAIVDECRRLGLTLIGLTPEYMNPAAAAFPIFRDVSRLMSGKSFRTYREHAFLLRPDRYVAATASVAGIAALLRHARQLMAIETQQMNAAALVSG